MSLYKSKQIIIIIAPKNDVIEGAGAIGRNNAPDKGLKKALNLYIF